MKTVIIEIDNLKCSGCENTIIKGLKSIENVENVLIDHDSNSIEIKYTGELEANIYLLKLAKMGYPEKGTSTNLQKAKSYVSCAIGKIFE